MEPDSAITDPVSYSNYMFGTFSLTADALMWKDLDGKEGSMAYADMISIRLGAGAYGGATGIGQASLVNDIGGTTANTISGTSATSTEGANVREMKLQSNHGAVSITMNAAMNDDAAAFGHFVTALHRKVAKANPVVTCKGGSGALMGVIVFSMILLVIGASLSFLGKAVGISQLFIGGALVAVGALILFAWGLINKRAKSYDPNHIPTDLMQG